MRHGRAIITMLLFAAAVGGCDQRPPREAPITTTQAVRISESAENGPVKVTVEADRDAVIVPQPVELTLTVESERGVEVTMPEIKDVLGGFMVKNIARAAPTSGDMYDRQSWTITLEPALPGDAEIAPITVTYTDARERADGSEGVAGATVETPALAIRVIENLADVKDPASLPIPGAYTVIIWLAAVIAVMAAIALAARWWGRRKRPVEARPASRVPAHEWALAQLDMLAAEGLIERGKIQDFYYRINYIVRRYIELRFGLMAGEQTSEEFVRELQRSVMLDPAHKDVLRQFVSACDPVKYAKHQPESPEIEWVQTTARQFVMQTAATQMMDETEGEPSLQEASA